MKLCQAILIIFALYFSISCNKKDPPTKPYGTSIPDTTSHDFEWEIKYFGEGSSSYLKDVAIIDENNIWAVGEIFTIDSTGELVYPIYNAIKWDGNEWIPVRVPVKPYYTDKLYITILNTIFLDDHENIWFNDGAALIQYDGANFHQKANFYIYNDTTFGSINKIWVNNNLNVYAVGNNGMVVYYNGENWQKLASPTTQPINDIWGVYNPQTQKSKIFCVASDKYHGGEKKVLQIMDDLTVQEFDWTQQKSAHSVWFGEDTPIYICGSGIHVYEDGQWHEVAGFISYYTNRVRGNHQNDVFVVGDFGLFAHYNGIDWKVYDELKLASGKYKGLAVKDDLVVAVGTTGFYAVVCIGRRKK